MSGAPPGAGFRLLGATPAARAIGAAGSAAVAGIEIAIEPGHPLFAGHFPQHPVLPGIGHLQLLEWVLAELAGRHVAIRQVRQVRWRRPLAPGDRVQLDLEPAGPGPAGAAWRFTLRCGASGAHPANAANAADRADAANRANRADAANRAGIASHGLIDCAAPAPSPPEAPLPIGEPAGARQPPTAGSPDVAGLLPHGPAARLLTGLASWDAAEARGHARVRADHPLAGGGTAPGWVALEIAAQAAAAWQAVLLPPRSAGAGAARPRLGYLVAAREAVLPPRLPADTPLHIAVTAAGGAGQLGTYRFTLAIGDGQAAAPRPAASGAISTFVEIGTP